MNCKMHDDIEKILFSADELEKRITELACELDEYYKGEEVVAVCILKGSVPFYWELVKNLSFPVQFDFMIVSSYGNGSESSGEVRIEKDLAANIEGKNVLIVEDILDSGNTLSKLKKMLTERKPKDIKICTLLDKPKRRTQNISADFVGFEIDDHFVVGFGLDYAEKYRQFSYIGILKPSVYIK